MFTASRVIKVAFKIPLQAFLCVSNLYILCTFKKITNYCSLKALDNFLSEDVSP